MPWEHEPPIAETTPRRCCRHLAGSAFLRSVGRQDAGSTLECMESLDDSEIVCCGHEPLEVPRRTESADKSDALQTLRAGRRRHTVAKRLEGVRLQRRFSKAGCDSMTRQVHYAGPEASAPAGRSPGAGSSLAISPSNSRMIRRAWRATGSSWVAKMIGLPLFARFS